MSGLDLEEYRCSDLPAILGDATVKLWRIGKTLHATPHCGSSALYMVNVNLGDVEGFKLCGRCNIADTDLRRLCLKALCIQNVNFLENSDSSTDFVAVYKAYEMVERNYTRLLQEEAPRAQAVLAKVLSWWKNVPARNMLPGDVVHYVWVDQLNGSAIAIAQKGFLAQHENLRAVTFESEEEKEYFYKRSSGGSSFPFEWPDSVGIITEEDNVKVLEAALTFWEDGEEMTVEKSLKLARAVFLAKV